jgi:hypothetical protein
MQYLLYRGEFGPYSIGTGQPLVLRVVRSSHCSLRTTDQQALRPNTLQLRSSSIPRLFVMSSIDIRIVDGRSACCVIEKPWYLSPGMTCRYAPWLNVALAGDATEGASQKSWDMPISVDTLARLHARYLLLLSAFVPNVSFLPHV